MPRSLPYAHPGYERNRICPRCQMPRDASAFDSEGICRACQRQVANRRKKFRTAHRKIDQLARTPGTQAQDVAKVCQALLASLGDENPVDAACEFLEKGYAEGLRGEFYLKQKTRLFIALLNAIAAMELLADAETKSRQLHAKALQELSTEEYKDALLPLAARLVNDNPQLAIKALDAAGYEVSLKKKVSKSGSESAT